MARKLKRKDNALDEKVFERAARIYRVLSHPVRLQIVNLLIDESVPVGILAEKIGAPPAAISQHLTMLRANNVVDAEREGKKMYYEVISPQAHYMIACLRDHANDI